VETGGHHLVRIGWYWIIRQLAIYPSR